MKNSERTPNIKVFEHWEALGRLASKRFLDQSLADEALLYVHKKLAEDGWEKVRAYKGKSSFKRYLFHVSARLMEDFARSKFGRLRPPAWLKRLGGMWERLYKLLCVEHMTIDEAIESYAAEHHEKQCRKAARDAAKKIRGKITDCGQRTPIFASEGQTQTDSIPDSGCNEYTSPPHKQREKAEKSATLDALTHILDAVSTTESPDHKHAKSLVGKLHGVKDKISLSSEERLLLKLVYWDGMNVSAAGRHLGLSAGKAHAKLNRAYKHIRSVFSDHDLLEDLHAVILSEE